MTPMELILAAALAGMATAIATGYMSVPSEVTGSSISISFMLILALIFFAYSPVVGIASIVLFAVIIFNRNLMKMSFASMNADYDRVNRHRNVNPRRNEYGDMNIYAENNSIMPYGSGVSGPRDYSQFRETRTSSWISEGFTSGDQVAAYNTFGSEQYASGQYPIDNQRVFANPYVEEYKFRPSLDTGKNEFERYGPQMDQKLQALPYQ